MKDWEKWQKEADERLKLLEYQDQLMKTHGQLAGRYIQEQYADGHAIYTITRVWKKKVKIEVVTGIGDDWVIPYWGEKTTIDREYAEQSIARRDNLAEIFS